MRGLKGLAALCVLAVLAVRAQSAGCTWAVGLDSNDEPVRLDADRWPKAAPRDWLLCRDGASMVRVHKGFPVPRSFPAGRALLITVSAPSAAMAEDIRLQWKPEGVPNLPEPFGRVATNPEGTATVYPPEGAAVIVWVDDLRYEPAVTLVPPGSALASLALVPQRGLCLQAASASGRAISVARLALLPAGALSSPLAAFAGSPELAETGADPTGRIVLLRVPSRSTGGWLHAPGYALLPLASLPASSRRITMEVAPSPNVHALDAGTRKPVASVAWSTHWSPPNLPWLGLSEKGEWNTEPGRLPLLALPCQATFRSAGYAAVSQSFPLRTGTADITVLLRRGVRIEGRVLNQQEHPIQDALVTVGEGTDPAGLHAFSDDKGRFVLAGVPADQGPITLAAIAEGFEDQKVQNLPAKDTASLVIRLRLGPAVSGRCVDGDTLQPVPGALLSLRSTGGQTFMPQSLQKTTDDDGAFQITGLKPGPYTLRASIRGRTSSAKDLMVDGKTPVELGDIPLSGHPRVHGTLLRSDGKEVSRFAKVQLHRQLSFQEVSQPGLPSALEGTVNEDGGGFSVSGVPAGRYRVSAQDGDSRAMSAVLAVAQDDVDAGALELKPMASVKGRLTGRDSFDGWRVQLMSQAFDPDPSESGSEADGSFDFGEVTPGSYRLGAFAPLDPQPKALRPLDLAPGEQADVQLPVDGVTLHAFVQVDGKPASGAYLRLNTPSSEAFDNGLVVINGSAGRVVLGLPSTSAGAQADGSGFVTIEDAPSGPVQASLSWSGMTYRMPFAVPPNPAGRVTLNFVGHVVQGRVFSPTGGGVGRVPVSLAFEGLGVQAGQSVPTDDSGRFQVSGLGEGTVILSVRDGSGRTAVRSVTISEDAATPEVELKLGPGGPPNPAP